MSLESHLNDATFGESMAGNGFDYFEICPHKGHPGGPGGVSPAPPPLGPPQYKYTIYIHDGVGVTKTCGGGMVVDFS